MPLNGDLLDSVGNFRERDGAMATSVVQSAPCMCRCQQVATQVMAGRHVQFIQNDSHGVAGAGPACECVSCRHHTAQTEQLIEVLVNTVDCT